MIGDLLSLRFSVSSSGRVDEREVCPKARETSDTEAP